MSLFSPIISIFKWLTGSAAAALKKEAAIAVTITETLKTLLSNPAANFLENLADTLTHTGIATTVANAISALIPKALAVELAVEGLPENATPDQLAAYEQSVLAAFDVKSNNSQLYTTLGAQILDIIIADKQQTFASLVKDIEDAYQLYLSETTAKAA